MTTERDAVPPVTEELLKGLEWRYAVPRCCRVCGAPLQASDSRGMKMTCTSDAASPLRSRHEPAGATWKEALDHWQGSTLYNPPEGDARVLALAAAFRSVRALAEDALFLRQSGERPPGGNETWREWDKQAEEVLRGFLPPEDLP